MFFLVNKITESKNWIYILKRFIDFKKFNKVECMSIPVLDNKKGSYKANQIKSWLENVEKFSLTKFLDYEYIFETDITDCYGSVYTHSISWALHTKEEAKKERKNFKLIGNIIESV